MKPDELSFYDDNGFLVVPDFLDANDLAAWREAIDEAVAERGDRMFGRPAALEELRETVGDGQREELEAFTIHFNLWQTSEKVRHLILDERLGKIAADLAGAEGIRLWHDQVLIKEPFASFTGFHLDNPADGFTSPDAVMFWVALDDATLENGCLYYVPSTHRARKDNNPDDWLRNLGALYSLYPEWGEIAPVPCPVPAGGACFHNGFTAHGAGANMTPGRRRAMTATYMPDGSTFNGVASALPPAYVATLEVGDVLNDDEHNPLIFHRDV